jgi:hypothetical protein
VWGKKRKKGLILVTLLLNLISFTLEIRPLGTIEVEENKEARLKCLPPYFPNLIRFLKRDNFFG